MISGYVQSSTKCTVMSISKSTHYLQDFSAIYDIFGSWSPSQQEVLEFPKKVCIPCMFSNCNLLKTLACMNTQAVKCMQIHVH